MNACTLTADQTSSELLVTSPLTVTLPFFGIEDGVRVSMVSDSGASSAAPRTVVRPPLPPAAPPWRPGCRTRATRPPPGQAAASSVGAPCDGSPGEASHRAGPLGWLPVSGAEIPPLRIADVQRSVSVELDRIAPVLDPLGALFADAGHELSLVGGPVRDAMLGRRAQRPRLRHVRAPRRHRAAAARLGRPPSGTWAATSGPSAAARGTGRSRSRRTAPTATTRPRASRPWTSATP